MIKPYFNFLDCVDELGRFKSLKVYKSNIQNKIETSHGYSIKYCHDELYNFVVDELLDKQEISFLNNPNFEMWYNEKKLKAIKNKFYLNHYMDENQEVLPELFFRTLNRFVKINYGYSLETSDSDLNNTYY